MPASGGGEHEQIRVTEEQASQFVDRVHPKSPHAEPGGAALRLGGASRLGERSGKGTIAPRFGLQDRDSALQNRMGISAEGQKLNEKDEILKQQMIQMYATPFNPETDAYHREEVLPGGGL